MISLGYLSPFNIILNHKNFSEFLQFSNIKISIPETLLIKNLCLNLKQNFKSLTSQKNDFDIQLTEGLEGFHNYTFLPYHFDYIENENYLYPLSEEATFGLNVSGMEINNFVENNRCSVNFVLEPFLVIAYELSFMC